MEDKYRKAFKEVYVILDRALKGDVDKIPRYFKEFIEKNMDIDYNPQIDFNESFENSVLEETLLILALIYRDYLVTEEERKILIEDEKKQLQELNEKYNIDNIFNKKQEKLEDGQILIEQQLIEIKKEKFYHKIIKFIKKYFL